MASERDAIYGFSLETADALVAKIGQTDLEPKDFELPPNTYSRNYLVATGSGIAKRSGTTPGSASLTVCKVSGGTIETTSQTITCLNLSSEESVESSCYTIARGDVSGTYYVDPPAITALRLNGNNLEAARNCGFSVEISGENCTTS